MLSVENNLVSDDLSLVKFVCDLKKCHGACCVEGDAGAPLAEEEISILEDCLDEVKPYMNEAGLAEVERIGVFDYDANGAYVTPLVNDKECAFVVFENETAICAIEKAYNAGRIKFQKPVSCHLYPVRIRKSRNDEVVNYHEWHVCRFALIHGRRLDVPLYIFLKEPLIRKYGRKWYINLVDQIGSKAKGDNSKRK
ncbi:MAG TPA: DUF3109 family protein [Bacteroidales bacterium]